MISRQFFKVKQKYDETVNQADKTEVLSADMSQVFKTVEIMKNTFIETRKKLNKYLITFSEEGKKGKNAELVLGKTLLGEADKYPTDSLLHTILLNIGQVTVATSVEFSTYEFNVDDQFRKELVRVIEIDIENLEKTKKKLSKARLDLDACKSRNKSAAGQNISTQKQQTLDTELSDAQSKFDALKDQFSMELLNFIAREKEFSLLYISMIEHARDYHEHAYKLLNEAIPGVRKLAETTIFQPIFGFPVSKLKEVFGSSLSFVLQECVEYVEKYGMTMEGIFRLAGSANRIKRLKAAFDAGVVNLNDDSFDVHTVCACLKTYLRELPEPLLTYALEKEFINVASLEINSRTSAVRNLLRTLPTDNYINLKYLIEFLVRVCEKSNENKMSPHNIAIVIGPNLIWPKETDTSMQLAYSSCAACICESMILKYDTIFKEEPSHDSK